MRYPMKLQPAISELVWGGTRLIEEYGIKSSKQNAAEAWMLSAHPAGPSTILNGEYAGKSLREVYLLDPGICGAHTASHADFPLLVKFIDAKQDLSVQVHPDDAYCAKIGKGAGKTEAWYILDAKPGAHLLLGFQREVSRENFAAAIRNNTLLDYVQKVPVQAGDFFFIPAGTLHAICGGVLLAEVQQSSDTTYRIYDYGRLGMDGMPRPLHVEDALAVTRREPYKQQTAPMHISQTADFTETCLIQHRYFTVHRLTIQGKYLQPVLSDTFTSLLVLDGSGSLECSGTQLPLDKGESILLPAACPAVTIRGNLQILKSFIS